MTFGRPRRNDPSPQPLPTAPRLTPQPSALGSLTLRSPLGDTTRTRQQGNTLTTSTQLGAGNQAVANQLLLNTQQTLGELNVTPQALVQQAEALANQQFEQLALTINDEAQQQRSQLESQNAQRFGGSLNATFGTDLLARQEAARLANLQQARLATTEAAQDRLAQQDAMRQQRLGLLTSVLDGLNATGTTASLQGLSLLQSDRNQVANRALALDELRQNTALRRQQLLDSRTQALRNNRNRQTDDLFSSALSIASLFAGG
jgi:hypothetical protein